MKATTIDGGNGPRTLESRNSLLTDVIGATGIKTGWTSDAGFCLVGSATRHDSELIAVVLGAATEAQRFSQATELLEWGFEHYGRRKFASEDETMGAVVVTDYIDREVIGVLDGIVSSAVFSLDGEISYVVVLPESIDAPVEKGQRLGTYTVKQGDRMLTQVPIVAAQSVPEPGFFERIWISIIRGWRRVGNCRRGIGLTSPMWNPGAGQMQRSFQEALRTTRGQTPTASWITPLCTYRGAMRRSSARGPASVCQLKRNGSARPGAAWNRGASPGAMS